MKSAFERNDRKLEGNITILKWIFKKEGLLCVTKPKPVEGCCARGGEQCGFKKEGNCSSSCNNY
jgi:hypothetical protein